ncbi:MAG TPA: RNA polymerase sigma factor [Kofleriaceae bacterium]|nr:RNA polymerase sigma factor [Kofleriaceae bacterium]
MPREDEKLESNQRWLKGLARRLARSPASAEDLVQETYLTALSKPPPDGPMRPWLHGVMRKLAWGEVRSGRRRALREECFHLTGRSVVEPDPLLAYGIDRARLCSIVEGLPEPFRSTVEQRFVEGLSCVEIAEAAGVPAGTVRWRQSRALELLRSELERSPRRRARRSLVWLPLVGLQRAVEIVGSRVLGLSGRARSGLALLGAALVVALVVLMGRDAPVGRGSNAEARTGGLSVQVSDAAAHLGLARLAAANDATLASASPHRTDGDPITGRRQAWRDGYSPSMLTPVGLEAAPDRLERDLYDCTDEGGELHCVRQQLTEDQASGPVCLVLDRSLSALSRPRLQAPGTPSIDEAAFLRAARLANLFLAAELGCALTSDPEREEQRGGGGATGKEHRSERTPEPVCQTEEDEPGRSCTTCTDEHGVVTTACAPVDCQVGTRRDGTPCTSCTDADGQAESDCEVESGGCGSEMLELDGFAAEILPILRGEIDLNGPDGDPYAGCARGSCHGSQHPGGFYLDLGDTPENNLERFACFVDLERPERSQILLCPSNDEGCATHPHPGPQALTGPGDFNYQRILAFIEAGGP